MKPADLSTCANHGLNNTTDCSGEEHAAYEFADRDATRLRPELSWQRQDKTSKQRVPPRDGHLRRARKNVTRTARSRTCSHLLQLNVCKHINPVATLIISDPASVDWSSRL